MFLEIKNIEALRNVEGQDILQIAIDEGILFYVDTSKNKTWLAPTKLELDMSKLIEWIEKKVKEDDGF